MLCPSPGFQGIVDAKLGGVVAAKPDGIADTKFFGVASAKLDGIAKAKLGGIVATCKEWTQIFSLPVTHAQIR